MKKCIAVAISCAMSAYGLNPGLALAEGANDPKVQPGVATDLQVESPVDSHGESATQPGVNVDNASTIASQPGTTPNPQPVATEQTTILTQPGTTVVQQQDSQALAPEAAEAEVSQVQQAGQEPVEPDTTVVAEQSVTQPEPAYDPWPTQPIAPQPALAAAVVEEPVVPATQPVEVVDPEPVTEGQGWVGEPHNPGHAPVAEQPEQLAVVEPVVTPPANTLDPHVEAAYDPWPVDPYAEEPMPEQAPAPVAPVVNDAGMVPVVVEEPVEQQPAVVDPVPAAPVEQGWLTQPTALAGVVQQQDSQALAPEAAEAEVSQVQQAGQEPVEPDTTVVAEQSVTQPEPAYDPWPTQPIAPQPALAAAVVEEPVVPATQPVEVVDPEPVTEGQGWVGEPHNPGHAPVAEQPEQPAVVEPVVTPPANTPVFELMAEQLSDAVLIQVSTPMD